MGTDEYEIEFAASREETAAVLQRLIDGVLAGRVQLGEEDGISVAVPDDLTVEVEWEQDADETSLEIELEWPTADSDEMAAERDAEVAAPDGDVSLETVADDPVAVGADGTLASLARFELFRDQSDEWRWRLRHRNGNIIATSGEGYTRKHNARKGLQSVIRNAPGASVGEE